VYLYFDASASRPAASGAARVRRNSEPYFKDPQQSRWRRGGLQMHQNKGRQSTSVGPGSHAISQFDRFGKVLYNKPDNC
ncbi:MAG: hypothetical protein ACREX9_14750, partial [Gammaproteobacteria bacterium]